MATGNPLWRNILLQHVEERRLARIVETEELPLGQYAIVEPHHCPQSTHQKLSVFVGEAQRGQKIPDYAYISALRSVGSSPVPAVERASAYTWRKLLASWVSTVARFGIVYQLTIHMVLFLGELLKR